MKDGRLALASAKRLGYLIETLGIDHSMVRIELGLLHRRMGYTWLEYLWYRIRPFFERRF